ncbi:hypothetical protein [Janibacter sp. GS2]|uniref:hypothetical protein n=1 Tax=Janibacter sp. GS2 TaxID=3442646 RepID=UPI003EB7B6BE
MSMGLGRRMSALGLDLWLVLSLGRMALGARDHFVRDVGILLLVAVAVVGVVTAVIVSAARCRRYDIHRHGLVLRGRRGEQVAVMLWASVDPGRIILSTPSRRVRAWTPRGLLDWATRPTIVLINGWVRGPNDLSQGRRHRYDTGTYDYPFGWWQLGVTDPVHLLTAIESAMIADGHAARGLTAAALSQSYSAGPATLAAARELERASADSVIGIAQQ